MLENLKAITQLVSVLEFEANECKKLVIIFKKNFKNETFESKGILTFLLGYGANSKTAARKGDAQEGLCADQILLHTLQQKIKIISVFTIELFISDDV